MIMKTAEQPARERLGTLCTPHEVKNLTPLNNSLLIFLLIQQIFMNTYSMQGPAH